MEDKLKQSEQAREQLAKELVRTKVSLECADNTIKKQQENIKELEAENERLKQQLADLQYAIIADVEWDELIRFGVETPLQHLRKCQDALKALQEIKEIIIQEKVTNDKKLRAILDLITKAEEE